MQTTICNLKFYTNLFLRITFRQNNSFLCVEHIFVLYSEINDSTENFNFNKIRCKSILLNCILGTEDTLSLLAWRCSITTSFQWDRASLKVAVNKHWYEVLLSNVLLFYIFTSIFLCFLIEILQISRLINLTADKT